jgi:hypothetical protein
VRGFASPRTGSRPLMVAGAPIAVGGVYWLSRIPVHGHYWTDLFPGLVIMAFGLGGVFVGVRARRGIRWRADRGECRGAAGSRRIEPGVPERGAAS